MFAINFSVGGLVAGVYAGTVTVQGGGAQVSVAVTLTVIATTTTLMVSPASVSFTYHTGHFPPAPVTVQVTLPPSGRISVSSTG